MPKCTLVNRLVKNSSNIQQTRMLCKFSLSNTNTIKRGSKLCKNNNSQSVKIKLIFCQIDKPSIVLLSLPKWIRWNDTLKVPPGEWSGQQTYNKSNVQNAYFLPFGNYALPPTYSSHPLKKIPSWSLCPTHRRQTKYKTWVSIHCFRRP